MYGEDYELGHHFSMRASHVLDLWHGAGKGIDALKKAGDNWEMVMGFPVACSQCS